MQMATFSSLTKDNELQRNKQKTIVKITIILGYLISEHSESNPLPINYIVTVLTRIAFLQIHQINTLVEVIAEYFECDVDLFLMSLSFMSS